MSASAAAVTSFTADDTLTLLHDIYAPPPLFTPYMFITPLIRYCLMLCAPCQRYIYATGAVAAMPLRHDVCR